MKYLQILNWVLFFAGAVMALVLGVVTLIMALYREEAAQVGAHFAGVAVATGMFAVFAAVAGVTVWSMHRRYPWRWLAQGALLAVLATLVQFVRQLG